MRANLAELAKLMRPLADQRARELVRQTEVEAGTPAEGFISAEADEAREDWQAMEAQLAAKPQKL